MGRPSLARTLWGPPVPLPPSSSHRPTALPHPQTFRPQVYGDRNRTFNCPQQQAFVNTSRGMTLSERASAWDTPFPHTRTRLYPAKSNLCLSSRCYLAHQVINLQLLFHKWGQFKCVSALSYSIYSACLFINIVHYAHSYSQSAL